jgi:hypothetical protein
MASQAEISKRIAREIGRGHEPKQASAIAYQELGEDMTESEWDGLVGGLLKFFEEEKKEPQHSVDDSYELKELYELLGKLQSLIRA